MGLKSERKWNWFRAITRKIQENLLVGAVVEIIGFIAGGALAVEKRYAQTA